MYAKYMKPKAGFEDGTYVPKHVLDNKLYLLEILLTGI
jgi:hypothetical protein